MQRMGEVFRFLRRRREEKKKLSAAHQKGRETIVELETIADSCASTIGAEVAEKIVGAFRDRLKQIHGRSEDPPLVLARIEWDAFEMDAKEFKAQSISEIERELSEWIILSAEIGCISLMYQVIDNRLTRMEADMYSAAADEIESFAKEVAQGTQTAH
jgi:hypothetical protein